MSECEHKEYMWIVRSPYDGTELCTNCGAVRPHEHTWELSWHKDAYCACGLRVGQDEAETILNEHAALKRLIKDEFDFGEGEIRHYLKHALFDKGG